ncbi:MAG: xylanase [Lachnospiraceae bacterium]|nr:xylanase [Lachnospiraceae bacterium]
MGAYESGKYRNLFKELGKTDEEIELRIKSIVNTFFFGSEEERIYHPAGDDMGYLEDTGNHDARTEGMSYGMMMCVQLDMKEEFDRIWKWAKTYMYMSEGENEGYFAWSCHTDGSKRAHGPAPDGEEFFAMSLFFASHRWGDGSGIFEYSKEAKEILRACLHKGENGRPGEPMWNRENKLILFVPGSPFSDPSYHLPHFYSLFAEWAYEEDRVFWKEAADASRKYLVKACDPVTGMNGEYAKFDGSPLTDPMPWDSSVHGDFYSDAYRTAANIGLDAAWYGIDEGHLGAPLKLMRFLGTDLEAARCVYTTKGDVVEKNVLHPLGLLAATAQGALAVPPDDGTDEDSDYAVALKWVEWLWNQPPRRGGRRYYDNCLYMFAYLALSGRYRIWK